MTVCFRLGFMGSTSLEARYLHAFAVIFGQCVRYFFARHQQFGSWRRIIAFLEYISPSLVTLTIHISGEPEDFVQQFQEAEMQRPIESVLKRFPELKRLYVRTPRPFRLG